jgi:hypothetical protein
MRIYAFEGLEPGYCRKSKAFDTYHQSLFILVKQNTGKRKARISPVTREVDKNSGPKKVKGIFLKNFGHTSFTISNKR